MPDHDVWTQIEGLAASCGANWDPGFEMLALQLNGHPRSQDFEPTGHGGSDPTAIAGTIAGGDRAAALGRELRRRRKRAYDDLRWMADELQKLQRAERPAFDPTNPDEYCRLHLQIDDYELRYRGDRCRACYERVLALRSAGKPEDITVDDLRYHKQRGRWPLQTVDPKNPFTKRYVATTEALLEGVQRIEEAG